MALAFGAVTLTVSPPVPALASSLSGGPMLRLKLTGSKSPIVSPLAVRADAPGAVPGAGGAGGLSWRAIVRAKTALPMPDCRPSIAPPAGAAGPGATPGAGAGGACSC